MSKHSHAFIRQDGLSIDAVAILEIIDAPGEKDRTAKEALDALKSAITQWVANTEEGKAAYEASSEDYNIGDFVDDYDNYSLKPYLASAGIARIKLETLCPDHSQSYDMHLVDDTELPD